MDKYASRIELFNATLEIIRQGWYIAQDGHKVKLPSVEEVVDMALMYRKIAMTSNSISSQRNYLLSETSLGLSVLG